VPAVPGERRAWDVPAYLDHARRACFVCELVAGTPGYEHEVVWRDGDGLVFVAKYPALWGHLLVVPLRHREHVIGDFAPDEYVALQRLVHRAGRALAAVVPAERLYVLSLGSQQATGTSTGTWCRCRRACRTRSSRSRCSRRSGDGCGSTRPTWPRSPVPSGMRWARHDRRAEGVVRTLFSRSVTGRRARLGMGTRGRVRATGPVRGELSLGTEGWRAGGSERFDDARIRKALERARRLHISVDGLEVDPELEDTELDDADIEAPAAAPGAAEAPPGPSNGHARDALRAPGPGPEARPWWAAGPAAGTAAPHTATPAAPPAGYTGPAGGSPAPGHAITAPPVGEPPTRPVGSPDRAFDGTAAPAAAPPAAPAPGAAGPERGRPAWAADLTSPGEDRTSWARRVEAWLPDLAAAAVASGALVAPWLWLLAVTGLTLAVAVMVAGAAGIGVARLPLHALRRSLALLHPRSLLWAPVITARTVILAVLLPAAVASAAWVLDEGAVGLAAAARAGVWTHALRVAAALVCFMLVRGVGPGRARRAEAVRRRLSEATDGTLGALALVCVVVTVVVVGLVPRVDRERLSGADGLAWLAPALRSPADRVRDRVVTTELDAVATCLTRRQATGWNRDYTSGNPPGDADVAELVVARGEPDPADVVTAVTAAHNQLAPWVETIEVTWNGSTVVQVDRSRLPHGHPVTDATRVVRAATAGRSMLEDGAPDLDRSTVLHCSAGPVL
jgi:hypothetical protein